MKDTVALKMQMQNIDGKKIFANIPPVPFSHIIVFGLISVHCLQYNDSLKHFTIEL